MYHGPYTVAAIIQDKNSALRTQRIEQRSIAVHNSPHMLSVEPVDRSVFKKTKEERKELSRAKTAFKNTPAYLEFYPRIKQAA